MKEELTCAKFSQQKWKWKKKIIASFLIKSNDVCQSIDSLSELIEEYKTTRCRRISDEIEQSFDLRREITDYCLLIWQQKLLLLSWRSRTKRKTKQKMSERCDELLWNDADKLDDAIEVEWLTNIARKTDINRQSMMSDWYIVVWCWCYHFVEW